MPDSQLKNADGYNIFIGNVKKLASNLFNKEKYENRLQRLASLFKSGLKFKKIHRALKLDQPKWLKQYT